MVVSQNHENILKRDEKKCRGIKNDRLEKYGTCFEYQEKETRLLWTCKRASFPTKKVLEVRWMENEAEEGEERVGQATVQCEGT